MSSAKASTNPFIFFQLGFFAALVIFPGRLAWPWAHAALERRLECLAWPRRKWLVPKKNQANTATPERRGGGGMPENPLQAEAGS